jgi:hypothetical protein
MKEFFVNARYLFGFLAPGLLWVATLLLLVDVNLKEALHAVSTVEIALVLAAGLVFGHALAGWSFGLCTNVSKLIQKLRDRILHKLLNRAAAGSNPKLVAHVRSLVNHRYAQDSYLTSLNDEDLSYFCGDYVTENSSRFAARILNDRARFVS